MLIIRGATTILKDCKEEICSAVKELLDEIFLINSLVKDEVTGVVFSLTTDIHSYHPAKAARECNYDFAPLFACVEPEIDGGLELCIRVMILVERDVELKNNIKHVYQKGAKILRTDISSIYNIALDGPAGSGKSTVAKALAKDYNILYLDTGAMYRACGLKALRLGISPKDERGVKSFIDDIDLKVEYLNGTQHIFLDGEDVSEKIRENPVSMAASDISAHTCVRLKMVEMQRKIAQSMSCVLDGRDIGSYVLPNAKFKFFLTADSRVRAERRYKELQAKGVSIDFETLHNEIILRDKQDSSREFAPLVQAKDAILIDSSNLSAEEVLATVKSYIQKEI